MMKSDRTREKGQGGSGMITVLVVVFAASMMLALAGRIASQRSHMTGRLSDEIRAQAIAETGIGEAYAQLASDFNIRTNADAFSVTSYDGGSYEVTVMPVGDDRVAIESTGIRNDAEVTIIVDARMLPIRADVDGSPYSHSILADENIAWTGAGAFQSNSSVHANGTFKQAGSGELDAHVSSTVSVTLNGNSGVIDGDVTAPKISGKTNKITGVITETEVDYVPIPVLDFAPYYNEALAHGEVYDGNQTLASSYAPSGGVMWVNGDLHLTGPDLFHGCFVATGDIRFSGSATHTKVNEYPAFMSRDGDIKFAGSGSSQGLVYALIGSVEIVGSGTLRGSIICGGNFKKAGVSTIFDYVKSIPTAPREVASDGILVVSAWHE
ncbi:MAG: hypothetical protein O2923_02415 [Verrucomicrobia bacterium]|nr:hypothetical protein [Verrucomicrobiota bacterium]MDA1086166.1 hypothetical protein [Verrucomicrobiota bacterium]